MKEQTPSNLLFKEFLINIKNIIRNSFSKIYLHLGQIYHAYKCIFGVLIV